MVFLSSSWGRVLFYAVSGIVLAWGLYHAGDRIYHYLLKPNPDVGRIAGLHRQPGTSSEVKLADIESARLFGKMAVQAVAPKSKEAPKTRLKLVLEGVISAGSGPSARAIIAERGKPGWPYAIGDKIQKTDATVDSIEPHQVLLERGGRLEKLEMNIPVLDFKKTKKMPTARFVSEEARP